MHIYSHWGSMSTPTSPSFLHCPHFNEQQITWEHPAFLRPPPTPLLLLIKERRGGGLERGREAQTHQPVSARSAELPEGLTLLELCFDIDDREESCLWRWLDCHCKNNIPRVWELFTALRVWESPVKFKRKKPLKEIKIKNKKKNIGGLLLGLQKLGKSKERLWNVVGHWLNLLDSGII